MKPSAFLNQNDKEMKNHLFYLFITLLVSSCTGTKIAKQEPNHFYSPTALEDKVEIMLLGSDHLSQLYEEGNPHTDVFTPKRQQELEQVIKLLQEFAPDAIMVEELPEEQAYTDSLYAGFRENRLALADIPYGRNEIYQIGFQLGNRLGHSRIYCVNAPGGTSQSVLDNGTNIAFYQEAIARTGKVAGEKGRQIESGSLSMLDYLQFLNEPQTIQLTHYMRYMAPARVTDGTFTNPDAMIDTAFINPKYIGAELTAVFKNRDYKIYSNIVTIQLREQSKRIVLIIGQTHVGSLQSIFRDDPGYTLVDANSYLKN